jgi:hypothetical protein
MGVRIELGDMGAIVVGEHRGHVSLDLPAGLFAVSGLIRPADAEKIGEAFLRAAEKAREFAALESASL